MTREHEQLCDQYTVSHQSLLTRCFGYSLALFCILRVASSIRNLILFGSESQQQGPSSPDIAAQVLAWVLNRLGFIVERNALARQISLLFIGVLIGVNIRTVLRECLRFLRLTDKQRGMAFMILLCSQLMAVYFLATLVQLLAALPSTDSAAYSSHGIENGQDMGLGSDGSSVFDKLPSFGLFSRLFDMSFLLTALWNVAVNSILHVIR